MVEVTLVNTHMHPPESNDLENQYSDLKDDFEGHWADPFEMHEKLDSDIGLVSTLTNHHEPGSSFERYLEQAEIDNEISVTEERDSWFTYELGGKRGSIVNGCESSTGFGRHSHFVHAFVPKDYQELQAGLDREQLHDISEDIPLNWVAHANAPGNSTPDGEIDAFLEEGEKRDFEAHLGFSQGYSPTINSISTGDFPYLDLIRGPGSELHDKAEEYDCSLVPELDWHAPVPPRCQGLGVVEGDSILAALEGGDIPYDHLRNMDAVGKKFYERPLTGVGLTWQHQLRNYPGALSRISDSLADLAVERWDNKENYHELKEEALETYEDVSADYVLDRAYSPMTERPI